MRRSDINRESDYWRRVRTITPIAIAVIACFFLLPNFDADQFLKEGFGWEGPTRILPEIAIIPDNDAFEAMRQESRRKTMTVLDIEEWEDTGEAEGATQQIELPDEPQQEKTQERGEQPARLYPAHTELSYSEDYVILHMIKPDYPPEELKQGVEGDVTLELLVDDGGWVEAAWVLMATGPNSFEQASLDAVRQFRFKPPIVDGRPVSMWIRFQIRFRIMG